MQPFSCPKADLGQTHKTPTTDRCCTPLSASKDSLTLCARRQLPHNMQLSLASAEETT